MENNIIKSTVNISSINYQSLKMLIQNKEISSMTEGINLGIELLMKQKRLEMYKKQIAEASNDRDFLERTMDAQYQFDRIESEDIAEW